jgi:hypothetical protein
MHERKSTELKLRVTTEVKTNPSLFLQREAILAVDNLSNMLAQRDSSGITLARNRADNPSPHSALIGSRTSAFDAGKFRVIRSRRTRTEGTINELLSGGYNAERRFFDCPNV